MGCRAGSQAEIMLSVTTSHADARATFEARVRSFQGRRVVSVDYWDVHNFGPEPAAWDYDDWHHAVVGVQLTTADGRVAVTWIDTFCPYGVDVCPEPISHHVTLGEAGAQRVGLGPTSRWDGLLGEPIRHVMISWDTLSLGPATRADGRIVGQPYDVDVPTALRLLFDGGQVWLVAGMPQFPT